MALSKDAPKKGSFRGSRTSEGNPVPVCFTSWLNLEIRSKQTSEQQEIAEWYYQVTQDPELAVMLLGMAEWIATDHAEWSWWQVMRAMKGNLPATGCGRQFGY